MVQASVGFHCPDCARQARGQTLSVHQLLDRTPYVTYVLIAANVAFFVLAIATAVGAGTQAAVWDLPQGGVADWGLLVGIGAYTDGSVVGVAADEWWRIVTGGFLHAGLLHLGMNMLVLWIIGAQLEKAIGPARYLCLYLTSLLAGSLGVLLIDPTTPTVGASGAVFGLMGAALIYQRSRGIDVWRSGLGTLILVNLGFTFLIPGISKGGHIGGLVGGALAGVVIFQLERVTKSVVPPVLATIAMGTLFFAGSIWAADQWRDPVLGFLSF